MLRYCVEVLCGCGCGCGGGCGCGWMIDRIERKHCYLRHDHLHTRLRLVA